MRPSLLALLPLLACAAPRTVAAPQAAGTPPAPLAAPAPPPAPSPACSAPERRALDFWIGDWDLVVRARSAPGVEQWAEAKATNRVRAGYGGCVIEERFLAEGPGQPWAGASLSVWVPALQAWRQTWTDDSGGYLAFRGGPEGEAFVLYGEPQEREGKKFQMRMVFDGITAEALRWRWERQAEGAGPWTTQMEIQYRRRSTPLPAP